MLDEPVKKGVIFLTLGLLTVSAFFIRLENFTNSRARSIDEVVYYRMAQQMSEDFFDYNTIPYAKDLSARGRPLPQYFFMPLYKYPPLFTMMLVQSFRLFGENIQSAAYVPILMGVLMIPLVYLLGTSVFGRMTGLLAAFFLYMDPPSIITSQKVWPDTPLAFLSLLSILFFIKGVAKRQTFLFVFCGFFCGTAALIKYPGLFLLPAYLVFTYFHAKELFKKPSYWSIYWIPCVMMAPWFLWNLEVYGLQFIIMQIDIHSSQLHQSQMKWKLLPFVVIFLLGMAWLLFKKDRQALFKQLREELEEKKQRLLCLTAVGLLILLSPYLWRAFQFYSLPNCGWRSGMFAFEPFYFYLGRLAEFSLIYLFGFVAYFVEHKDKNKQRSALMWTNAIILFIYILWANFQTRYILVTIPLFLTLASFQIIELLKLISKSTHRPTVRIIGCIVVAFFLAFALMKTARINAYISYPNNLCYY